MITIIAAVAANRAIGFEKNIGNRANNLYPQEWRIKSSHVPAEELIIKN